MPEPPLSEVDCETQLGPASFEETFGGVQLLEPPPDISETTSNAAQQNVEYLRTA